MDFSPKTYGDFVEMDSRNEHMVIQFRAATLDMDELWESSLLSASFLSSFWGKFFPLHGRDAKRRRTEMEDAVRYIAGELIGNAVKFSHEPQFLIKIALCMSDSELHFYVTNSISPQNDETYQNFVEEVLGRDPDELYVEQMEKNAMEGCEESCMGFLTMMLDYGATLAWKFEKQRDSGVMVATTMARVSVVRNFQ